MTELPFSNKQIIIEKLPQTDDLAYISLEKDYLKVSMISSGIFCFILLVGSLIGFFMTNGSLENWQRYLIFIPPFFLITLIMFMTYKGYWYKSYALRNHDIVYKRGYIYRSKIIIPFNRVQHCEVNQGPIDRIFGLSELKIFTAGGASSDMKIPGLTPETANSLKHFIARKTGDGISEEE